MGTESTKTQLTRSKEFINTYFSGDVIDIGGGNDPVVKYAEVFDLIHGDAQYILNYKNKESYDCVNSSHCLEHMKDVPSAIFQWWELVRPGGYMVTVVPHEDLYEQKVWPSIFNLDHKATFRLKRKSSWSPVSYDIYDLMKNGYFSKNTSILAIHTGGLQAIEGMNSLLKKKGLPLINI